eukprot:CAMPEP_0183785900 /NCGR_PEP_ID=MMETSP0739-20130205/66743_1 /TAXON_ID=385413 /ORGANISM="Thalassiosira miniscula, Strain CCMP1093" /LENGTH=616 /DNA_ID=CAMNT_0026029921 /DNA_START=241 /DNA_END=2091 /DNA_ORIENTATION=+
MRKWHSPGIPNRDDIRSNNGSQGKNHSFEMVPLSAEVGNDLHHDHDYDYGNDTDDSSYVNGDDAFHPEYSDSKRTKKNKKKEKNVELWRDDIRSNNGSQGKNHSFEMVPLSAEVGEPLEFDYDNEDDNNFDGIGRNNNGGATTRRGHPSSSNLISVGVGSGDDYESSNSLLAKCLSKNIYQYIFPPDVPRTVQLCRPENIAVPACYLLVGLLQGLSGPFTNVYPLDLNASEAQQTTISSLKSLPASFKLAFGFFSDNCPLFGYRRKSYMLLGWAIASLSMFLLLFFSDLSVEAIEKYNSQQENMEDGSSGRYRHLQSASTGIMDDPNAYSTVGEPPSIPFLSFTLLLFGLGFWFADVMGDSIVAEKAKLEPESSRGHLQSTCYACRFFGLMIAAPLSTVIYSSYGPRSVVVLMAMLPASIVPMIYMLQEKKNGPVASTKEQCGEIWTTVCSRAVWQPMGFVYLYNVLQVGNAAWKQFLKTVLGFTSNQLNTLLIVAYVLLWLGIMAYKKFFIRWSWRTVYISTTLLNGLFSALQILLIQGITFGLSPFLFALGDDAFADFIGGIQFLPTTIMMVHLCPSGSEGASYAMFTTVNNSAYTLATAFSTICNLRNFHLIK